MLHEHVLHEPVGFLHVAIVVPLANLSDLVKRLVAHHLSRFAESLEAVLGLPCHHDVADEAKEIALASRVCQVPSSSKRCADELLRRSRGSSELRLILLQHALVLPHVRNVAGAEIAKAGVLRVVFVVFERIQERLVL